MLRHISAYLESKYFCVSQIDDNMSNQEFKELNLKLEESTMKIIDLENTNLNFGGPLKYIGL